MFHRFSRLNIRFAAATATLTTASLNINTNRFDCLTPQPSVCRILFTGGPCGGKSTALSTTQQFLMNHGFIVYTVPESATILRLGGISPSYHTLLQFQHIVTTLQTSFENLYFYYAQHSSEIHQKPVVILIDRGIMDGKAYITDDKEFCDVLQTAGHNINYDNHCNFDGILSRYDMVLHLVSASKGAPQFYKKEVYRHESLQDAIELDDRLISIYQKHQNRRIIYNDSTFDNKIQSIIAHIAEFVDVPNVMRKPLRFVIKVKDINTDKYLRNDDIELIINNIKKCITNDNEALDVVTTDITKTFLTLPNKENKRTFIRKTTVLMDDKEKELNEIMDIGDNILSTNIVNDRNNNYMMIESSEEFGQTIHKSMQLNKKRYDQYKEFNANQDLKEVNQTTVSFYFRGTYCSLNIFKEPNNAKQIIVLKLYRSTKQKYIDKNGNLLIDLPKCIVVEKNVTDDDNHTTFGIAAGYNQ